MKILVLCYEFPPLGGGGGRVARQVAEALAARGHELRVLTSGMKHLPRHEVSNGLEIDRIRCLRRREDRCSVPEMAAYVAAALPPALAACRRWHPDVLHAHFAVPTGALALAVSKMTGIPYVVTAHLGDVPGGVPEQTRHLYAALGPFITPIWRNASGLTAVCTHVAALAGKAYSVKPEVIWNGLPMPKEAPAPRSRSQTPKILIVGRLSVQKDPVRAVRVLSLLRHLDWSAEFIGDGPLRGEVESAVREGQLGERILLSGWQDSTAIEFSMRSADVLLMTSKSEGLPLTGVEALQRGLAIVGTDVGGMSDVVVPGQNGLLVPPGASDDQFATELSRLLTNRDFLSRAQAASWNLAARFDLDRICDAYEVVLNNACRSRRLG